MQLFYEIFYCIIVNISELERKFVKNSSATGGARTTPLGDGPPAMCRSSARKSRIADSFFEAKERLEETLAVQADHSRTPSSSKESIISPVPAQNQQQTVITLSESSIKHSLGIEVNLLFKISA